MLDQAKEVQMSSSTIYVPPNLCVTYAIQLFSNTYPNGQRYAKVGFSHTFCVKTEK